METIVDRIKEIAGTKGISLASIERHTDLGNGTISRWSDRDPSMSNLSKVAAYLDVKIDYLVNGKK